MLSLACGIGFAGTAGAALLFSEDFESGLDPRGSIIGISPGFGLVTGSSLDPSGDAANTGVGHSGPYANSSHTPAQQMYDLYQLELDLRGFEDIKLSFNYGIEVLDFFDVFGVLAYLDVGGALVEPTPDLSGFPANQTFVFTAPTDVQAITGTRVNPTRAVFEFAPGINDRVAIIQIGLAQNSITLPAGGVNGAGIFIDNILIEGARIPTPAPVPATLSLLGFGLLGLLGFGRYRLRSQS
jgi:hypothetical protein